MTRVGPGGRKRIMAKQKFYEERKNDFFYIFILARSNKKIGFLEIPELDEKQCTEKERRSKRKFVGYQYA